MDVVYSERDDLQETECMTADIISDCLIINQ